MKFPEDLRIAGEKSLSGVFFVEISVAKFYIIATNEDLMDHVSVTLGNINDRSPTWEEMCAIKDLFWDDEEEVVQIHPKKSEYVNMHPYCLHLWRPQNVQTISDIFNNTIARLK